MANPILVPLGAAILDRIVLENLKPDSPSKAFLNDTLTAALKNTLSSALAGGSYVALAALVEKIGHVDMAANKDASVRTFVSNQVGPMVANDPTMKEAIDAEVAKLSDKTTLGTLLGLDIPLKDHPLFQAEVRKADL